MKTLVKVIGTARASAVRIISNWKNIFEENLEEKEDELMIILKNLREKQSGLKQINREVFYATWWRRITKWCDSMWRGQV